MLAKFKQRKYQKFLILFYTMLKLDCLAILSMNKI